MKDLFNRFMEWLAELPAQRWVAAVAGGITAAFFAITLCMDFCIWPVIFVVGIVEFIRAWKFKDGGWKNLIAALAGALVPQFFVLLRLWWF